MRWFTACSVQAHFAMSALPRSLPKWRAAELDLQGLGRTSHGATDAIVKNDLFDAARGLFDQVGDGFAATSPISDMVGFAGR